MDPASQPHDGNGRNHPEPAPPDDRERDDEDEPERPREPLRSRLGRWRREHPRGVWLVVAAVVALVAIAVIVWWYLHTHESTDDAQIDGHIAPVSARVAGDRKSVV